MKSPPRPPASGPAPRRRRPAGAILAALAAAALPFGPAARAETGDSAPRGAYFPAQAYVPRPLPRFAALRGRLPAPIYDQRPEWIGLYWKAWELAFRNFRQPAPASHFVSPFIDAAFNQDIFLWDTCFMSMFCNQAYPLVPGIGSLDNFYARQHADGEISREIVRATGEDFGPWINRERRSLFSRWGWVSTSPDAAVVYRGRLAPEPPPQLTLDALDNPLPAWAELESYRATGDGQRVARVFPALVHYYRALQTYLRQGNGLYVTDWAGMDNSPRNPYLAGGGTAVDTSCQMVLFARDLSTMAEMLGDEGRSRAYAREADELSRTINRLMWDPDRRFYFDLTLEGKRVPVKTVAAFWALLAKVADRSQAASLLAALNDPRTFGRPLRVPTLAADEPGYDPAGGYWRGSVWAPTTMMVIRGLENYGYRDEAAEIALENLDAMSRVFRETGTIWENYAPEGARPGKPAKADFVGWSGLGPIDWLIEFAIGLEPDSARNELTWTLRSPRRQGCERYRFNGHVVSLLAVPTPDAGRFVLSIRSDGAFTLNLRRGPRGQTVAVLPGRQRFEF